MEEKNLEQNQLIKLSKKNKLTLDQANANLVRARQRLLKQITTYNKAEVVNFENALNSIVTHERFPEIAMAAFDTVSTKISDKVEQMEPRTSVLAAKYKSDSEAATEIQAWRSKYYQLKNQVDQTEDKILQAAQEADAWRRITQLQTPLNKVAGQMFENFLQIAAPLAESTASEMSGKIINDIINSLVSGGKSIKTKGSEHTSQITFTLDDKIMSLKGGTSKIDVSVPSPSLIRHNALANISAKNYASISRNIELLSGNLTPLILSWPTNASTKSYFYNALYEFNTDKYLQYTRCIFAIQSLVGIDTEKADLFIAYIRNRKTKPIMVHSTKMLLNDILGSNNDKTITEAFPMKLSKSLPLQEGYPESANQVKLNTQLNRQYLQLAYLRKIRS